MLFGAPRLARNMAVSGRRKLPGREAFVTVVPEVFELESNLQALSLSREQLIDIGILVGTDFNEGVKGYGPKKALKLIKEHHRLEEACAAKGIRLPPYADEIRKFFLNPPTMDASQVKAGPPDFERLLQIFVEKHQFSRQRVEAALGKIMAVASAKQQRNLDAFF